MKVRIINHTKKGIFDWWYIGEIGNVFEVEKTDDRKYFTKPYGRVVLKEDAEVVEDVEGCDKKQRHTHIIDNKTGTTEEAKHYQVADVQPIEIMQSIMSKEQFEGYLLGNVIKYALRLNHKGQKVSDAGKCKQYADWLQVAMNGGKIIPGGK